ncbi:MAG: type II toxin-antitoxin system Phd/YefM family antitoxin [Spirochaetia bacterium]|jgi:antitoxin (DNA-binding transcriptional repressor) of toxin-antitoxin stability system
MIIMSVTDFSRNLKSALNKLEEAGEEIVLIRNKRRIGRIVPGEPFMTAREAMGDLCGILPDAAAEGWIEAGRDTQTLGDKSRDAWAG